MSPCETAASPLAVLDLEGLDRPRLGVDPADRHRAIGHDGREPEIAVEIGRGVMRQRADARRRSQ